MGGGEGERGRPIEERPTFLEIRIFYGKLASYFVLSQKFCLPLPNNIVLT